MINANEIIKLLESGKSAEAKKQLENFIGSLKVSQEDAGRIYADLAMLYVKVQNAFLEQYKDLLEEMVDELKKLNLKEKEIKSA